MCAVCTFPLCCVDFLWVRQCPTVFCRHALRLIGYRLHTSSCFTLYTSICALYVNCCCRQQKFPQGPLSYLILDSSWYVPCDGQTGQPEGALTYMLCRIDPRPLTSMTRMSGWKVDGCHCNEINVFIRTVGYTELPVCHLLPRHH